MTGSRFRRQTGLVHQSRVEDLLLRVEGDGIGLPYVLSQLVLLGAGRRHGGIFIVTKRGTVIERDLAGPIPFETGDIGKPYGQACAWALRRIDPDARVFADHSASRADARIIISDGSPPPQSGSDLCIFSQVSATAMYVGLAPVQMDSMPDPLLGPSLACLCAAIAIQEMLVRCRCIRQQTIAGGWLSANLVLRGEAGAAVRKEFPLGVVFRWPDGTKLMSIAEKKHELYKKLEATDGLVRVLLPMDDAGVQRMLDAVSVIELPTELPAAEPVIFSPLGHIEIADGRLIEPARLKFDSLEDKHVFVAGVGALGSWLTLLFVASSTRRCTLTLVDHDGAVERHNLNRQVLYSERDIGNPKVTAAAARLQQLNADHDYRPIRAMITEQFIEAARGGHVQEWEAFQEEPEFRVIPGIGRFPRDSSGVLASEIIGADAVVGCLDNLLARYRLNVFCESAGVPLLNAASQDFDAVAHRIDPRRADPCLVCRVGEKARTDDTVVSCNEEGVIPMQSIVTSSAVAASLQTLFLLISLSGGGPAAGGINFVAYDGRRNRLTVSASRPRWPDECPGHLLTGPLAGLSIRKRHRGANR